jgi:hypothetical protein
VTAGGLAGDAGIGKNPSPVGRLVLIVVGLNGSGTREVGTVGGKTTGSLAPTCRVSDRTTGERGAFIRSSKTVAKPVKLAVMFLVSRAFRLTSKSLFLLINACVLTSCCVIVALAAVLGLDGNISRASGFAVVLFGNINRAFGFTVVLFGNTSCAFGFELILDDNTNRASGLGAKLRGVIIGLTGCGVDNWVLGCLEITSLAKARKLD